MNDHACIRFLQWSLPQLNYRWRGFRKVRRQVCRRIQQRMKALGVTDIVEYQQHLEAHPDEWRYLDSCCDISVTHFYRDKQIFELIGQQLLPTLAKQAQQAGANVLRCWSLGCCSGDEPYTLRLIWHLSVQPRLAHPCTLEIVATDRNARFLQRAHNALFSHSSLKDLPADYVAQGFSCEGDHYRLKAAYRNSVEFVRQDIRQACPDGKFDLICCRNLVFTYFDTELQATVLNRICRQLSHGGFLVVGAHENLPTGDWPLLLDPACNAFYRKT